MNRAIVTITFCFLLTIPGITNEWDVSILPVSDIKPGMKGVTHTVFYGEKIEDVAVEVIDVMTNYYPKLDIILVKLLGEQAEKNGVVSGMSGSPVIINEKLVGALAFRLGTFLKEPIAGVMPIEAMMEISSKEQQREQMKTGSAGTGDHYLSGLLGGTNETFWSTHLPTIEPTIMGLERISSPLTFSGFQSEIVHPFEPVFRSLGFSPMLAGSASSDTESSSFEPGSAVSIVFLTGDMSIEATGTVTAVAPGKLLAFGHQLFNFGSIALPLAGTKVYTTLPSMMGSSKVSAATAVLGTFVQDRLSGALGDLTRTPEMIPVKLTVESPNESTTYQFRLADDPAFRNILPLYLRMALIQAMYSARLAGELNSCHLRGAIRLTDNRSIQLDDWFTSTQQFGFLASGMDIVSASDLVTVLLGTVLVHDFSSPGIEEIDLNLQNISGKKYARIESVWQDKTEVEPGDSVIFRITLRDQDEKVQTLHRTVPIPSNISGRRLSIFVSSGTSLTRYEQKVNRQKFVPENFDHLLSIVEKRRKPQNVYLQVRLRDNGLMINDEEMNVLPPSIYNALNTGASSGVNTRINDRVIYEDSIPMQNVIAGARQLSLTIKSPTEATSMNEKKPVWHY